MKTECSVAYCMGTLTPTEYVIYQAICELWCGGETASSYQVISDASGISKRVVQDRLKTIQKHGFIVYTSQKQKGLVLLWVRLGEYEKAPKNLRYVSTTRLRDSSGRVYTVRYWEMRKFCREHGVDRKGVYALINGTQSSHLGWTLVSAG